jgi:hypothetical protein
VKKRKRRDKTEEKEKKSKEKKSAIDMWAPHTFKIFFAD